MSPSDTSAMHPLPRWRRWAAAARRFWVQQRELQERLLIMNRPWTHDEAHWGAEQGDGGCVLHGSVPPRGRSRGPVTTGGWCPCIAAERRRRQLDQLLSSSEDL